MLLKSLPSPTIPYESYKQEEAKVIPSESEIQAYFAKENAIAHRYWSPEKRSGVLWVFDRRVTELLARLIKHPKIFLV